MSALDNGEAYRRVDSVTGPPKKTHRRVAPADYRSLLLRNTRPSHSVADLSSYDYLSKRSCLDRSVSPISRYDNTRRRALTFEKLERGRYCAVAEESLPMSNRHRIYFQTELVNEIML